MIDLILDYIIALLETPGMTQPDKLRLLHQAVELYLAEAAWVTN